MAVAHRKLDERRKETFIENVERLGSLNAAAVATDTENKNTIRTYKIAMLTDPVCSQQVESSMARFADRMQAVVR